MFTASAQLKPWLKPAWKAAGKVTMNSPADCTACTTDTPARGDGEARASERQAGVQDGECHTVAKARVGRQQRRQAVQQVWLLPGAGQPA